MSKIPFRQIHLDFHTSPYIGGIGETFNKDEFVATLKAAHVNSINLFAKCHHGMYYYPTKLGTMHPHLKFDLFGEQVKACKENGIRAVAYTCVVWNEDWCDRHPEWQVRDYHGILGGLKPFDRKHYQWRNLCVNNPDYKEMMKQEFKEIYDNYQPAGYWIDIIVGKDCVCPHCQKDMRDFGLDPTCYEDVKKFNKIVEIKFCKEMTEYIKSLNPDLELYYNSHPYELEDAENPELSSLTKREAFDFIDIESLPSETWGYTHFPVAANYVNKYDQEICMMNGKFHTAWGDFGSLRNKNALEYECFRALAHGARICVGDQMHPGGTLDPVVYGRIGEVFEKVEKMEGYAADARKVRDIAVMIPTKACEGNPQLGGMTEEGVYRMLSELHIPFDFVNAKDPLDGYKLLILPDDVHISDETAAKIDAYVADGGRILVTGSSGVKDGKFNVKSICADYVAPAEYDTRYIRFKDEAFADLPAIDHVLYHPGEQVEAKGEVLASIVNPYFARTYEHFCSHRQTPPQFDAEDGPAIVKDAHGIYVAFPAFRAYCDYGYVIYRDIIAKCIEELYEEPVFRTDLPQLTETTLWEKEEGLVVHMLNYVIQKKAKKLDTIEDVYTVLNKKLAVKCDYEPKAVVKLPEKTPVPYIYEDGYVNIKIECEQGYTAYLIER